MSREDPSRLLSYGLPNIPRRWTLKSADEAIAGRLSEEMNLHPLLGRLLALRGISGADEAKIFLNAPLTALHDPFLMKGMGIAAAHLAREIMKGRPIGVYGDYDTDGISSTALLVLFFTSLGVSVPYFIPSRMREGYGLHLSGLKDLKAAGCKTVVTVDTGIAAVKTAHAAKAEGVDLIITDHHHPPIQLPEAMAVINPRQVGCEYPFKALSGVGVAFKLATAVRRQLRDEGFEGTIPNLKQHLDLVAIGTVADIAPLWDENHIFVRGGLEVLSSSLGRSGSTQPSRPGKPGFRALLAASNLKADVLTAGHIGFVLAPRLNAAGRVGDARLGVELLTGDDGAEARSHAEILEEWNRQRQNLEREAYEEALGRLEAARLPGERRSIVLASDRWHPGVIGIVASRLVERFHRPVVLIHVDGDVGKGSCRGVSGIHMVEALGSCSDLLTQFGGHKGAAGLSIQRKDVEPFSERFEAIARKSLEDQPTEAELFFDAAVDFAELGISLVETIEKMAPFGSGNPQPILATARVDVVGRPESVGRDSKHLKMRLRQRGEIIDSIGFGLGGLLDDPSILKGKLDVAYHASMNRWRGRSSVQIQIKALRSACG